MMQPRRKRDRLPIRGRHATSNNQVPSQGDQGMKLIRAALLAVLSTIGLATVADAETVVVRAGKMLDVDHGRYLADRAIRIEDGRIVSVTPWTSNSRSGGRFIDWSAYTSFANLNIVSSCAAP